MSTKNKTILTFAAIMALAALIVALLVYPTYNDIVNNSKELILEKQKMLALEQKITNIQYFKDNHDQIGSNITEAQGLFATAEAPVNFISFLENIASDSNVTMQIVPSVPMQEKGDVWQSIIFKIDTASTFPNFLKFLDKLESGPYLIETEALQIKRLDESALKAKQFENFSVGDANGSITLKVYAQ